MLAGVNTLDLRAARLDRDRVLADTRSAAARLMDAASQVEPAGLGPPVLLFGPSPGGATCPKSACQYTLGDLPHTSLVPRGTAGRLDRPFSLTGWDAIGRDPTNIRGDVSWQGSCTGPTANDSLDRRSLAASISSTTSVSASMVRSAASSTIASSCRSTSFVDKVDGGDGEDTIDYSGADRGLNIDLSPASLRRTLAVRDARSSQTQVTEVAEAVDAVSARNSTTPSPARLPTIVSMAVPATTSFTPAPATTR